MSPARGAGAALPEALAEGSGPARGGRRGPEVEAGQPRGSRGGGGWAAGAGGAAGTGAGSGGGRGLAGAARCPRLVSRAGDGAMSRRRRPSPVQVEGEGGRVALADGEPELLTRGLPARWTRAGEGM